MSFFTSLGLVAVWAALVPSCLRPSTPVSTPAPARRELGVRAVSEVLPDGGCRVRVDTDGDDRFEVSTVTDTQGNTVKDFDTDEDGRIESRWEARVGPPRIEMRWSDQDGDGRFERRETHTYSADGQSFRQVLELDEDGDGNFLQVSETVRSTTME